MIDLHLHLDGALSRASVRELASLQGITVPADDAQLLELMRVSPSCRDLDEFLEKFAFPCSLLQTDKGLSRAVAKLCDELENDGLIYAEIRFAPCKCCEKGMSQEDAVLAALSGLRESGALCCPDISSADRFAANLILCCMRGASEQENTETVRLARKYLGSGVCAVDLAGAEALFPNSDYSDVFALARSLGVPFEIHAGEADGPSSVRSALALGASRIGHGVRGAGDTLLLRQLADSQIPLMLCPTSNVQTCVYADVADMPVRTLMDAGVKITVNTDDPSIEGTDLRSEWVKIINAFHLTDDEVKGIMLNSVDASFASAELKTALRAKVVDGFRDFLGREPFQNWF